MNIPRLLIGIGTAAAGTIVGGALMGGDFGRNDASSRSSDHSLRIVGGATSAGGSIAGLVLGHSSLTKISHLEQIEAATGTWHGGSELLGMMAGTGAAIVGGLFVGQSIFHLLHPAKSGAAHVSAKR
jgi:hypothetical protein